jgi:hypothetical protein
MNGTKLWLRHKTAGVSPLPLRGHSSHVRGGKHVLLYGGTGGGGNVSSTATVMELNTGGLKAWNLSKTTGAGPAPRHLHATVSVRDDSTESETIYFYGGVSLDNTKYFSDVFALNAKTMTWSSVRFQGVPPVARAGCSLVAVSLSSESKSTAAVTLWAYGGRYLMKTLNELVRITISKSHLAGNQMQLVSVSNEGPGARYLPTVWVVGTKMFLFGGLNQGGEPQNDMWCLDLAEDAKQWNAIPYSGTVSARYHSPGELYAGRYLILFGGKGVHDTALSDLCIFDTEKCTWTVMESGRDGPGPRWGHTLALIGKQLYVLGGHDTDPDLWILQLDKINWHTLSSGASGAPTSDVAPFSWKSMSASSSSANSTAASSVALVSTSSAAPTPTTTLSATNTPIPTPTSPTKTTVASILASTVNVSSSSSSTADTVNVPTSASSSSSTVTSALSATSSMDTVNIATLNPAEVSSSSSSSLSLSSAASTAVSTASSLATTTVSNAFSFAVSDSVLSSSSSKICAPRGVPDVSVPHDNVASASASNRTLTTETALSTPPPLPKSSIPKRSRPNIVGANKERSASLKLASSSAPPHTADTAPSLPLSSNAVASTKLQQVVEERDRLQRQLVVLQNTLQDKERAEHALQEENRLLKERLGILPANSNTTAHHNDSTSRATVSSQSVEALERSVKALTESLETSQQRVKEVEAELSAQRQEYAKLNERAERTAKELQTLRHEHAELLRKFREESDTLKLTAEDRDTLYSLCTQLTAECQRLQEDLEQLKAAPHSPQNTAAKSTPRTDVDALQRQIRQLEASKSELTAKCSELVKENEKTTQLVLSLQNELQEMEVKFHREREVSTRLQSEVESLKAQIQRLQQQPKSSPSPSSMRSLSQSSATPNRVKELEALLTQKEDIIRKLTEENAQWSAAASQLQTLSEEMVKELRGEIDDLKKAHDELNELYNTERERRRKAETQLLETEKKLGDLETIFAKVMGNTKPQ